MVQIGHDLIPKPLGIMVGKYILGDAGLISGSLWAAGSEPRGLCCIGFKQNQRCDNRMLRGLNKWADIGGLWGLVYGGYTGILSRPTESAEHPSALG